MISIGLPAIKTQFLREAIGSVLDQTFKDFELIVYNDRADVGVRETAGLFDDPRIRYLEGDSALEVVDNWNKVLSCARGEYFALFSDDDRYHPGFLAEMNRLITSYPQCHIFHCRVNKVDVQGKHLEYTATCPEFEPGADFILHRVKGDREHFAPEFIVRTEKLRALGGFVDLPLAWGTDDMTWFNLAVIGGIAFCSKPLLDWRQSPLQISETGNIRKRLDAVNRYCLLLESLLKNLKLSEDNDQQVIRQALLLLDDYAARQKAHLVAVNARHNSWVGQIMFFLNYRRTYQLKNQWLIYSLYAKLRQ